MGLAATKLSRGEPTGSKDKEIISLKEEIKHLQMTLEQENPEKLKVNERNTKDQVSSEVINNQEKEIKRLNPTETCVLGDLNSPNDSTDSQ